MERTRGRRPSIAAQQPKPLSCSPQNRDAAAAASQLRVCRCRSDALLVRRAATRPREKQISVRQGRTAAQQPSPLLALAFLRGFTFPQRVRSHSCVAAASS
ncbi:unnamed protein product, partial [Musa textilis]